MIGLEVSYKDKILKASIADGSLGVTVGKSNEGFYVIFSGMEQESNLYHKWIDEYGLAQIERVSIQICEVTESSTPIEQKVILPPNMEINDEAKRNNLLKRYTQLKQILSDKGLI